MTQEQHSQLEKEVVFAAHQAEKDVAAYRLRLSITGQHLESLGRALQHHPSEISLLPDPYSLYDHCEGVKILRDGQTVIAMLIELRNLEQRAKDAEQKKNRFSLKPSGAQDSEA